MIDWKERGRNFRDAIGRDSFLFAVAAGQVPGCSIAKMRGRCDDVGALDFPTDLAPNISAGVGVAVKSPLPALAGIQMKMSSTEAVDKGVAVRLYLLGADGVQENEWVDGQLDAADGTVFVDLPANTSRINNVRVVGTQLLTGTLDIVDSATGLLIYSRITPRAQGHYTGVYTIPAGHKGYVYDLIVTVARDLGPESVSNFTVCVGSPELPRGDEFLVSLQRSGNSIADLKQQLTDELDELNDVCLAGESSTADVAMFARMSILIVDERLLS